METGDIIDTLVYRLGLGGGQFSHAPSSGKVVSYANLYTDYYIAHYYGAVRYTK